MNLSIGYEQLKAPLDAKEELYYVRLLENGENEARQSLIEHNMRLVYFIANKYKKSNPDVEELASIGTIGLIKAVNSYNSKKQVKLSTYAARCIENEIFMHFRQLKKHQNTVSLEDVIRFDKEGNETCMGDLIGTNKDDLEEKIVQKDHINRLYIILNTLEEKEQEVLKMRYGIGREKVTQINIALELNISQSYISRIERKALKKIKKEMQKIS